MSVPTVSIRPLGQMCEWQLWYSLTLAQIVVLESKKGTMSLYLPVCNVTVRHEKPISILTTTLLST